MERHDRHLGPLVIFGVATALGIFSSLQAYNYVSLFTDAPRPFHFLLALNVTYWYAWAVLVPGMVWKKDPGGSSPPGVRVKGAGSR
jgi:hypothetical protein